MVNPFSKIYQQCKTEPLSENPKLLLADVELCGGKCNLQCGMCPVPTGEFMRARGFMKLDVLVNVVTQLTELGCKAVRFVRWGEPTIHPYFTKCIKIAKSRGMLVHYNTNGQLWDDDLVTCTLKHVDSIKFSLQGADKYEYERIRKGAKFDKLCEWIKTLHARRGQAKRPFIEVGTTVTKETPERSKFFHDRFAEITDNITIGKTVSIINNTSRGNNPRCWEFNKVSVNWDGTVSFCCSDYNNYMLVGDLAKQSLRDIWHGEIAIYYRKLLMNNKHQELPLCKSCYA